MFACARLCSCLCVCIYLCASVRRVRGSTLTPFRFPVGSRTPSTQPFMTSLTDKTQANVDVLEVLWLAGAC